MKTQMTMLAKKTLLVWVMAMATTTLCAQSKTIDYTDLDKATCIHGTFANMSAGKNLDTAKIDYGPGNQNSCHTVHTDVTDYNAHTNYLLRCTTPDGRPAVRLGNMITGGDASRVDYTYTVDANNTILVLDYAAILEDPDHSKAEQPKFTMELFDEDGQSLGDACFSFNFIAGNTTDGWQTVEGKDYVWKDWTSMGVNLRPYIGKTIKIQLTVYDCKPSGHFGYAYYALEVQSDQMKSTICGALEENVIFTAPSGFEYVWYVEGTDPEDPENVLSVDQSFIHETLTMPERTYMCDVVNTENPDCKFTLSATPKPRFPLADFDVARHTGVCYDTLYITNKSGVSADNVHLNDPYEPCDNFLWDFGDGRTSDEENPGYIVYSKPGTYTISLTVGLDNWTCASDSTDKNHKTFKVLVGEITSESFDTVCYGDTLWWHGKPLYRNGTYVDTIASSMGCDSICTFHLSYYPQYNRVSRKVYNEALACGYDLNKIRPGIFDTAATASWEDPYMLDRGTIEHDTVCEDFFYWSVTGKTYTKTDFYIENLPTSHGCDSLVFLDLRLNSGYYELKQDTIQWGQTYTWVGHKDKATGKSQFTLPGSYFDTIPDVTRPGCDSVFQLDLVVKLDPITTEEWDTICQGQSYSWTGHDPARFGSLTIDSTYADTLKSVAMGVDSVYAFLYLTVQEPIDEPQEQDTICQGQSYTWTGHAGFEDLTKAGTYRDTLRYQFGCDSIRYELILTVLDTTVGDTAASICQNKLPFVWYEHTMLETDTVVKHIFEGGNQYGCDSIVTLQLTVLDTVAVNDGDTVCSNTLPYDWKDGEDVVYTFTKDDWQKGELKKVHTFAGVNTCDSVVTFELTVLDTVAVNDGDTVCSNTLPYDWMNGTEVVYTFTTEDWQKGELQKVHTFAGVNTCDSVVTFTLVVNDTAAVTTGDITCASALPYEWKHGAEVVYTFTKEDWQAGDLTRIHTFAGVNTCDSVVTFTLTVMDTIAVNDGDTVCSNSLPYDWMNKTEVVYTFTTEDWQKGELTKVHTFQASSGCDSTVTFTLTVLDTIAVSDGDIVCSNKLPYEWKNGAEVVYTFTKDDWQKGELQKVHTFAGVNTCDSVVTFTLTVNDTVATSDGATICSNKLPYEWKHGAEVVYTFTTEDWQAGDLTKVHTFAGVNTCDSVVTFTLTVNDTAAVTTGDVTCASALPYEWKHGAEVVYTFTKEDWQAGDLTRVHTFAGVNTCDSVVTFTLVVMDTIAVNDGDIVCSNKLPYDWMHKTEVVYTFTKEDWQTGDLTKVHTFQASSGCDSTVTFTLTVLDTIAVSDGDIVCSNKLPYEWKNGAEVVYTFTTDDWQKGELQKVHTFAGVNTCDSVVTFTLTVNDTVATSDGATICSNKLPYEWKHGAEVVYTFTTEDWQAGDLTKEHTFAGVNTCDSVVTFTLTVNDTAAVTTGDVTCASALPYEWKHGAEVVYTFTKEDWQAGDLTRIHTFAGVNTCDSVVTFTLVVNDTVAVTDGDVTCSNHLPYEWKNGSEIVYTFTKADYEAGRLTKVHTFQTSRGCDSTVTFTLVVNAVTSGEEWASEEDNKLPYMWNGIACTETKDYTVTLTNAAGCDSVATLHFTVIITKCTSLKATLEVDNTICGDDSYVQGVLKVTEGEAVSYSVTYGKKDPHGHLQDLQDVPFSGGSMQIPFAPVADTTKYIRPDAYPMTISVVDSCDVTTNFDATLYVLYPSWILKQRWNDVIALYNDKFNGGYKFSSIRWFHEGKLIPGRGANNSYIYVEGDDTRTLDFGTDYWAGLVREGETEEICTCHLRPEYTSNFQTSYAPLVQISSRNRGRELHLTTEVSGSYRMYDVCGRCLGEGVFGEEYKTYQISLPASFTSGTYILVFRSDEGDSETHKIALE